MTKPLLLIALRSTPLFMAWLVSAAVHAQSSSNNVLGLPAVPQTSVAPAPGAPAARPASSPSPSTSPSPGTPTDAEIKSALAGNISLASFYQEGLVTVRISTVKTFVGSAPRAQALQAARLVQRDIRLACGKLCKPGPMPAPALQADNTLRFDLVIAGYAGTLSTADMVNLVNAKAIGPGGKPVPVPPPVPLSASATAAPATASSTAPPTASSTASSSASATATTPSAATPSVTTTP